MGRLLPFRENSALVVVVCLFEVCRYRDDSVFLKGLVCLKSGILP